MSIDSSILIDELVIPEKIEDSGKRAEWVSCMDIAMMAGNGGQERTKSNWEELVTAVGLKLVDIREYDCMGNSILIVKKE